MKNLQDFNFERISKYYQQGSKTGFFQNISDKVWHDLDMDEVFSRIDHSHTKYGQQYLYYSLRLVCEGPLVNQDLENTISSVSKNERFHSFLEKKLLRLSNSDSYFLCSLFQNEEPKKADLTVVFLLLSLLSIFGVCASFFIDWMVFPTILLISCNFIIHYWNKLNVTLQSSTFGQLSEMLSASKQIIQAQNRLGFKLVKEPQIVGINSLIFKASKFKPSIQGLGEFAALVDYGFDLIKAAFLIEALLYYAIIKEIVQKRTLIESHFVNVAYLDFALAIQKFRGSNNSVTLPAATDELILNGIGIFHPLLPDYVVNSISIDRNGVLITGANMSGKSTFLRNIGLNCLLAQTINCVFAAEMTIPKMKLYSSIQTFDDLESDKSYFYSEAESMKEMLSGSISKDFNLFLIDEIFKGTNSSERLVISSEILKQLAHDRSMVIATTHDLELVSELADFMFFYFSGEDIEGKYRYDYRLKQGVLKSTNAVFVLRDMGYPPALIEKIKAKLTNE